MTGGPDAVEIRILGYPLDVSRDAREHFDELLREFELILADPDDMSGRHEIPRRLLDLITRLRSTYGQMGEAADAARMAAQRAGHTSVDLVYAVPPAVGGACAELLQMLHDADEYCRRGTHLLTLAAPDAAVEFRRWFLGEFVAQAAGAPPTSWPDHRHRRPAP